MKERLILGFDGSPHPCGNCERLLKESLDIISKNGVETEYIKLIDLRLPTFHGRYVEEGPDEHEKL